MLKLLPLSLLFVLFSTVFASGQTKVATIVSTNAASATPPTASISLSDVVNQADQAETKLHDLQDALASDKTISRVEEGLPSITRAIDERQADTAWLLSSNPSLSSLRSSRSSWAQLKAQATALQQVLSERIAQLDDQVGTLAQQTKTWQAVQQQAKKAAIPPEIVTRINTTLADLARVARDTETLRARILSTQNRVSEQDSRISSALAKLTQAQATAVSLLFTRDSEPLWKFDLRHTRMSIAADTPVAQITELSAYIAEKFPTIVLHASLFVILAVLFFGLRNKTRVWAKNEPAWHYTAQVLDVPVATAALLALLFSHQLYGIAPRLFWAVLGAATLIPAVIVLRRLIVSSLFPVLYAMVLSYFLDQLRFVNAGFEPMARILFVGEMLTASLFLLWLLRSSSTSETPVLKNSLAHIIRFFAHVAFYVFIFAGLSNVLGYVHLANLAGNGILQSSYLAIILYAAVRIGDALVITLMRIRPLTLLEIVRRHADLLTVNLSRYLRWIVFVVWVIATLEIFSLRSPLWQGLKPILNASLPLHSLPISLGSVLACGIAVWLSFVLSRFLRFVLQEEVYRHFALPTGVPYAISTSAHYVVLVIGFFIAISILKVPTTQFAVLAGAFGVGLGFGLQTIMNNFVSGIILLFERPIKVGDVIQLDPNNIGVVERIGIRASVLRANNGAEIIVPNGNLISNQVINWTLSNNQRLVEVPVTVSSKTDQQKIIQLLLEIARSHALVLKEPSPQALLDSFTATTFNFILRAWIGSYDQWQKVRSDLFLAINAALAKENIPLS